MSARAAFVTSGARGLGFAIVRALLASGWDVFFTCHTSVDRARWLVAEAERAGRRAAFAVADLYDRQQVLAAAAQAQREFAALDALIHNFGPFVFERIPLAEYSDERWQQMLDGNLSNFFWLYRELVHGMRSRGFGRIVTVGYDGAGEAAGWRFRAAYAAAKSGLAALTRSIAREERQNGITANMVCPGDIRGENKMKRVADLPEADDRLGRPPVGEDVARVIAFLCREDSQQLNGTVTLVTGGYDIRAYDDGKDVVDEPALFQPGESVWVIPWNCRGQVTDVQRIPNRQVVYRVAGAGRSGSFTRFQLRPER
ncbi:MAG: SDR family oxidoreductase [Alicyclobacillus sp.]|nr:SDR family oxidoreductase [Alicyclobacillus sp.]